MLAAVREEGLAESRIASGDFYFIFFLGMLGYVGVYKRHHRLRCSFAASGVSLRWARDTGVVRPTRGVSPSDRGLGPRAFEKRMA